MQQQEVERQIAPTGIQSRSNSQNEFWIDVANWLSIFGLIFGGFITYELLQPRIATNTTAHSVAHKITAPIQISIAHLQNQPD
jgi:hypothetical protein